MPWVNHANEIGMDQVVLLLIERATLSIVKMGALDVTDEAAFGEALEVDLVALRNGAQYPMKTDHLEWLRTHFQVEIDSDRFDLEIRAFHWLDELPYEVHTGKELRLMLEGSKPLAVFSDTYTPTQEHWWFPDDEFSGYVRSGQFVRREYVELPTRPLPLPFRGSRVLLFARPGEERRIDACISMKAAAAKSGWSEGFERPEGSLLGYHDWQTDAFLQLQRTRASARRQA